MIVWIAAPLVAGMKALGVPRLVVNAPAMMTGRRQDPAALAHAANAAVPEDQPTTIAPLANARPGATTTRVNARATVRSADRDRLPGTWMVVRRARVDHFLMASDGPHLGAEAASGAMRTTLPADAGPTAAIPADGPPASGQARAIRATCVGVW